MKIICVDNYDRGIYEPVVVAENVNRTYAFRIARLLNEEEEDESPNYYMVKEPSQLD